VARGGQRQMALYLSGRRHAGENLAELLDKRPPETAPPIQMSDALSANWTGEFERIVAKCLAHARRQFVELEAAFPRECARVLNTLAEVYCHDAQTKQMTACERLAYHRAHSGEVMERLHAWITEQFDACLVEPNSSLGRALTYMRKHWDGLTKFLTVEGAPLDNNLCESLEVGGAPEKECALLQNAAWGSDRRLSDEHHQDVRFEQHQRVGVSVSTGQE